MAQRKMRLIDSDGHIVESLEEMKEFMDPAMKAYFETRRAFASSIGPFPGLDGIHQFADDAPIYRPWQAESGRRLGSAEDWSALNDRIGFEHSVLFTSDGLAIGTLRDRAYTVALCRAYNDYIAERYRKIDPRLHPMALIPIQFPAEGARELKRAVMELNLPGAMITSTGLPLPAGNEFFWPVYKQAAELDCVLALHGGSNRGLGLDNVTNFVASHVVHHPVGLMYGLLSLALEGAMERYPVRFACLEGGVEWVILVLERTRRDEYFFKGKSIRSYFENGRVLIGCEGNDRAISYLAKDIGVGFLAFSSDYPHEAGPQDVQREVDETIEAEALSDDDKAAILGDNARKFYRLD